jgi:hypothetical protein
VQQLNTRYMTTTTAMAGYTARPPYTKPRSKSDFTNIVQQAYDKPSLYCPFEKDSGHSSWNPKSWSRRRWLVIGLIIVFALVVAVVLAIEIGRANRYPEYSSLDYRLAQTYSGSNLFDNFNYFSGYDPAQGFVQ